LTDAAFANELGRRAQELVIRQQGATDRTIELIERLLPGSNRHSLHDKAA